MGNYLDSYLLPLPKNNLDEYRRIARKASKVLLEPGTLHCIESVADDAKPGKLTSFSQAVKLRRGETVVLAFILFRSRSHRDRVNNKAMNDPRLASWSELTMPGDATRMFWGGLRTIVNEQPRGA